MSDITAQLKAERADADDHVIFRAGVLVDVLDSAKGQSKLDRVSRDMLDLLRGALDARDAVIARQRQARS